MWDITQKRLREHLYRVPFDYKYIDGKKFYKPFKGDWQPYRCDDEYFQQLIQEAEEKKNVVLKLDDEVFEFLTVDEKTILSQTNEIESICGVNVMFPSQFVEGYLDASNNA